MHTKGLSRLEDKFFRCDTCGKSVKENRTLMKHTKMHTEDISHRSMNKKKPNCCPNCWKVFKTAKILRIHKKTNCNRKSSKLQENILRQGAMTNDGDMINNIHTIAVKFIPEEGELGEGLEEGELKTLTLM